MMRQCKYDFLKGKKTKRERKKERPMHGLMDCTHGKANMVWMHAVCVCPERHLALV